MATNLLPPRTISPKMAAGIIGDLALRNGFIDYYPDYKLQAIQANPTQRAVWELASNGRRALVEALEDENLDNEVGAFIGQVLAYTFKSKDRTPSQLADEIFSDKDREQLSSMSMGQGHTCPLFQKVPFVVNFHANNTRTITKLKTHKWKTCDACYTDRVNRFAKQVSIEAENHTLYFTRFDNAGNKDKWKTVSERWKKRKTRGTEIVYQCYPDYDGAWVIHNQEMEGGEHWKDKNELQALIRSWAYTPDGRYVSSSLGFGGEYAKTRGDSSQAGKKKRDADRQAVYKSVRVALDKLVEFHDLKFILSVIHDAAADLKKSIKLWEYSQKQLYNLLWHEWHGKQPPSKENTTMGKRRISVLKALVGALDVETPLSQILSQFRCEYGYRSAVKILERCKELSNREALHLLYDRFQADLQPIGEMSLILHNREYREYLIQNGGHLGKQTLSPDLTEEFFARVSHEI